MSEEKIKLFFAKHSTIISIVTFLVFLLIVSLCLKKTNLLRIIENMSDTKFAVYGTLLGAIVGGVFTLIGTNFVNKQQIKAQAQIKRKNLIYKPLYDELIEIHNCYLIENPYPLYVKIGKNKLSFPNYSPQYTVWERIKTDTRYLETPECLKKEMISLYSYINNYITSMYDINETITDILNETLKSELSTECTIMNIGDVLANDVLSENKEDIFEEMSDALNPPVNVNSEVKEKINNLFYEKCKQSDKLQRIKEAKILWLKQQERVIELLTTLISFVTTKYEG